MPWPKRWIDSLRKPHRLRARPATGVPRYGFLIENYAGRMPLWLAPVQIVVATITDAADAYAAEVQAAFAAAGLRAELDLRNEKINFKVRDHSLAKVPAIAVVGANEIEARTVAVRRLGGKNQEILALAEAVDRLKKEAEPPAGQTRNRGSTVRP